MEAGAVPRIAAPRLPKLTPRLIRLASDARLVALVREGRAGAFEALYDRHHRAILSFCRHLLGDQHEAEDVVQHTFMAAYSSLLASQQPIQLRPWLFTIARNRCYSLLRSQRERPTAELEEPVTDGLASEVQRRQDLRDLVGDLRRLPDEQRAAIVLAELDSLSHADIAEVLDVPRDKVKALVFQARESLLASRTARDTACHEIRQQLAGARGGALRRSNLRRHLRDCEGCRAYRADVQRQRRQFAALLPVAPALLLKEGLLAAALGAGGAAAVGGSGLIASSALKTGFLKGIAAALIAGAGTLGTVVVSTSDLPVRVLDGGSASPAARAASSHRGDRAAAGHRSASETSSSAIVPVAQVAPDTLGSSAGAASRSATRESARDRAAARAQARQDRHALADHRHGKATGRGSANAGAAPRGKSQVVQIPPGHSAAHFNRVPPGLARKSSAGLPPGLARKSPAGLPPGLARKSSAGLPPGLAKKLAGAGWGRAGGAGHGHRNGHGNGHGWGHR